MRNNRMWGKQADKSRHVSEYLNTVIARKTSVSLVITDHKLQHDY